MANFSYAGQASLTAPNAATAAAQAASQGQPTIGALNGGAGAPPPPAGDFWSQFPLHPAYQQTQPVQPPGASPMAPVSGAPPASPALRPGTIGALSGLAPGTPSTQPVAPPAGTPMRPVAGSAMGGLVRMRSPFGTVHLVPAAQVDEATAQGGQRI